MITLTREEAQQVLKGLMSGEPGANRKSIIDMIRARLAQPEPEPDPLLNSVHCQCGASWTYKNGELDYKPSKKQKEWQGLTDEEIEIVTGCDKNKPLWIAILNVSRATEAKLKEKND